MLNRNLALLVLVSTGLLATVTGQPNRLHRRVRADANRRLSPQQASMFDIEEVGLFWVHAVILFLYLFAYIHLFLDLLVEKLLGTRT